MECKKFPNNNGCFLSRQKVLPRIRILSRYLGCVDWLYMKYNQAYGLFVKRLALELQKRWMSKSCCEESRASSRFLPSAVYNWALDPGLCNRKSLCSSVNGIRHGLPKRPPRSLGMKSTNISQKAQSECICTQMTDKILVYVNICSNELHIYEYIYPKGTALQMTRNLCCWQSGVLCKCVYNNLWKLSQHDYDKS